MWFFHYIMPSAAAVTIVSLCYFLAIRQTLVFAFNAYNGFGGKLIVHAIVHRNPMAVVNALALGPYLFAYIIDVWFSSIFRLVPTNKINPFFRQSCVFKNHWMVFVPVQLFSKTQNHPFRVNAEWYWISIHACAFYLNAWGIKKQSINIVL